MKTCVLSALVFVSICALADGVMPRVYYRNQMEAAKIKARAAMIHKTRSSSRDGYIRSDMTRIRSRGFRPTVTRCCKIGEKTARKRLSCSASVHSVARKNNVVHKAKLKIHGDGAIGYTYAKELALKIAKCSVLYSKQFEKCCHYRADYIRARESCRSKPRPERRKCRQQARKRFL